jgi:hypothetical protein
MLVCHVIRKIIVTMAYSPNIVHHTLDVESPAHRTTSLLLESTITPLVRCFVDCYLQSSVTRMLPSKL